MRVQKQHRHRSPRRRVVQLLKSWEYKNVLHWMVLHRLVVQLLKSWEYKNCIDVEDVPAKLYSYLNLESTKTKVSKRLEILTVVQLLKSWEYKNLAFLFPPWTMVVQLLKSWEYKNKHLFHKATPWVVQLLKSWEYKNLKWFLRVSYPHSDYKINNCSCQSLLSKNFCKSFSSDFCKYLIR